MEKIHLGKFLKKCWKKLVFAVFCMVAAIILDMMYPMITKSIVDDVIIGGDTRWLGWLLISILIIGLGRAVCGYFKEYTFDTVGCSVGSDLRKDLFRHIQGLSMDYFDKTNTGELMARVKDDVDRIWDAFGMVGMLTIEVVIHVSMVIFCMVNLSWKLTLIPLAVMIFLGTLAIIMEKKLDQVYEDISETNAELTTVAEENLAGVRTVKAFTKENFEIQKFLKKNKEYYKLNVKQSIVLVRFYPYFQFVGKLLPVLMIVVGGVSVIHGEMTLGALVAFVQYCRNIVWPMEVLGEMTNEISAVVASYKKINKIYQQSATITNPEHPVVLPQVKGDIAFENVSFNRENQAILQNVSFHVAPGQTIGIMGATGAGKSSIINLLERFFDVTQGSVKLDGVDVRELTIQQLRGSISPVMQDVFLFSDTIRENICMGERDQLGMDQIKSAAKLAQASEFIEEMDEQYDTVIGERGVGLSGGQKQRISIARSFAKNCPILILDDSTSALDMETELEIQRALGQVKGITKMIVAHRISAVRNADEIIVLDKGMIVERGTHEELLKKQGFYYDTYMAQYGDFLEVS
ncbi:MAG: ABC transporter ATP-binding protein [Lachnospiraceae bacterium]